MWLKFSVFIVLNLSGRSTKPLSSLFLGTVASAESIVTHTHARTPLLLFAIYYAKEHEPGTPRPRSA